MRSHAENAITHMARRPTATFCLEILQSAHVLRQRTGDAPPPPLLSHPSHLYIYLSSPRAKPDNAGGGRARNRPGDIGLYSVAILCAPFDAPATRVDNMRVPCRHAKSGAETRWRADTAARMSGGAGALGPARPGRSSFTLWAAGLRLGPGARTSCTLTRTRWTAPWITTGAGDTFTGVPPWGGLERGQPHGTGPRTGDPAPPPSWSRARGPAARRDPRPAGGAGVPGP